MKKLLSFFTLMLMLGCSKDLTEPVEELANLVFTSTKTPATASLEGNIVSAVKCYGPNLCYRFKEFEIKETGARQYEIRAKATYPAGENTVCPQALYEVDTIVSIDPPTAGQYILRFYNGSSLFKADTVQVN